MKAGIKLSADDLFPDLRKMGSVYRNTVNRLEEDKIEAYLVGYPGSNRIGTYIPVMWEGIGRSQALIWQVYKGPVRYRKAICHRDTMSTDIPAVLLHGGNGHPMRALFVDMVFPHQICEWSAARNNKNRASGVLKNRNDFGYMRDQTPAYFYDERPLHNKKLSFTRFIKEGHKLTPCTCFSPQFSFSLMFALVAASATQIVEFCPNPYLPEDPDEFIVLEGSGSLDGITITDGEGGFRFPPGTTINGRLTMAYNGVAFEKTHGRYPDWEWYNYSSSVPDVIRGGVLKLSNSGDDLELLLGSITLQKVSWPGNVTPREGQIHYLEEGVWDRRPLFIGQSRLRPAVFTGVDGEAFVSPDCSLEVFLSVVDDAREESSGECL